jgi:aryl-alcohol dehydrogenase-like predicted oxidoreductase
VDDLPENDFRRFHPRFSPDNFAANLRLVEHVRSLAADKGVTPAQLALAWVLSRGKDVVPIPGTTRQSHLQDNLAATDTTFTAAELARIDEMLPRGAAAGDRYPEVAMRSIDRG